MDEHNTHCNKPGETQEPIFNGEYSFNTGRIKTLSWFDYFVFMLTICVTAGIGLRVAWKTRNRCMNEYLLADRSMSALPTALSLVGGALSGIVVIGFPSLLYRYGTVELWQIVAYPIATAAVAQTFVPVLYNLKITSIYAYLEKRFDKNVRLVGATYLLLMGMVYVSLVLFAPSQALDAVFGLNSTVSMILIGSLCIAYTSLGGVRAVILTDMFQTGLLFVGVVASVIGSMVTVGGFGGVYDTASRSNRLTAFSYSAFRPDLSRESTFYAIFVSSFTVCLYNFGVNQMHVHRCLCCSDDKVAVKAMYLAIPVMFVIMLISGISGLYAARFYEHCDPVEAGIIKNYNQVVPLFVMDVLTNVNGFAGLFMASLMAATLSTCSSGLNSMAAVVLEDFFRVYLWAHIEESKGRLMIQVVTVVVGLVCLELAFFSAKIQGGIFVVNQIVSGALGSPLLGVFVLGFFFPWANSKGAMWGMLVSSALSAVMIIAQRGLGIDKPDSAFTCISNCNISALTVTPSLRHETFTTPLPTESPMKNLSAFLKLSSRLLGTFSMFVTIAIGLVVSFATGKQDLETVDPVLIVPVCDVLFPFYYLPETIREKMRFGINHTGKWERYNEKLAHEREKVRQELEKDTATSHRTRSSMTNRSAEDAPLKLHLRDDQSEKRDSIASRVTVESTV